MFSEITRLPLACSVFVATYAFWRLARHHRCLECVVVEQGHAPMCCVVHMMRQVWQGVVPQYDTWRPHYTTDTYEDFAGIERYVGTKTLSAKGSLTSHNRNLYTQTSISIVIYDHHKDWIVKSPAVCFKQLHVETRFILQTEGQLKVPSKTSRMLLRSCERLMTDMQWRAVSVHAAIRCGTVYVSC